MQGPAQTFGFRARVAQPAAAGRLLRCGHPDLIFSNEGLEAAGAKAAAITEALMLPAERGAVVCRRSHL